MSDQKISAFAATYGTASDLSNMVLPGEALGVNKAYTVALFDTRYQASSANLTSWAAITRASGLDTFVATPTSANLLALLTTKTGTGNAVFSIQPTLTGPVTINPAATSLDQGLIITQTGPTSGSTSGPTSFNTETITYSSTTTGAGSDSFGVGNTGVFGHRINFTISGVNVGGGLIRGLGVHMPVNSTAAFTDGVAIVGTAMINSALTNTGTIEGVSANSIINSGGSVTRTTALEASQSILTGGSATNRAGIVISTNGNVQASTVDTAILVSSTTGTGQFKNFVTFSSAWLGSHGISTSANLFTSDTALTVANVFNFSNVTVSSNILNFPNVTLSGAGVLTLPTVIGGTGAGSSLTLQSTSGVGTSDFIKFLVGNAGATEAARFDTSGNFLIGSTSAFAVNSEFATAFTPVVQIHSAGAAATFSLTRWSNNVSQGRIVLSKSRGASVGSHVVAQSGDSIGSFIFDADDGTSFQTAAHIGAVVDGTPGAGSMPGRIVFSTTPSGTNLTTDRMTINSTGFVNIVSGSLGRGAPVVKTADFTVATTENWLVNNKAAATCTVTLPSASSFSGREITITNRQAFTVVSASSNVVPIAGGAASTAILAATAGKFATLVSDGTNWLIMAAN